MAIIWCAGEEIDFPTRTGSTQVTTSTYFRAGYARGALDIRPQAAIGTLACASATFASTYTSLWFSARVGHASTKPTIDARIVGFGKAGTSGGFAVGVGSVNTKIAVHKITSGGTSARLVEESGTSVPDTTHVRIDAQFTGMGGAGGHVNVWVDGVLVINADVDLTVSGVTSIDNFSAWSPGTSSTQHTYLSEVIVADEDTRLMGLVTLAPSAAGDANTFTAGTYAEVDEAILNDADLLSSDTADQNVQLACTNLPAGSFSIKAVKITARASCGASGITGIKLGVKSGGTVDVDASAQTLTTAWDTKERLMAQNPVTTNNFTSAEIDALQIALRSAA